MWNSLVIASIDQALFALDYFQRSRDSVPRQQGIAQAVGGHVGIGQPFPVGEQASTGHAQGVEGGGADGDGIGQFLRIQTEDFSNSVG